ncbi:MAG: 23S rRNA pseudouridine(1911/1915/1917) synthase RluD [Gammaproteobacteria bacterium]|nr:23S rRNA pseudouridine(1911/1915/1917) synthase RluD [Gammaproteobacteria bacterium]
MYQEIQLTALVPEKLGSDRLDQIAAILFPDYSRARLQLWIKAGELTVDGNHLRPKDKLYGGELLEINTRLEVIEENLPQEIEFVTIYEDDHIIVINKPAGLVTHPAPGNRDKTLLNGLLYRYAELGMVPRAGIVHRLDRDTSGLMVVARNIVSQNKLVAQLQARSMTRLYEAVVYGIVKNSGTINLPIGRHPVNRKKMSVRENGREAITHYRILQAFAAHTHLAVKLETGRTHQIRVHLGYKRHPLVGDPVYGGTFRNPATGSVELKSVLANFKRQALHARELELDHPSTGERVSWNVDLPPDMLELLRILIDNREQVT